MSELVIGKDPALAADRLALRITGMHCGGCAKRVREALTALDGVRAAKRRRGRAGTASICASTA
jgi:hypothetical protein